MISINNVYQKVLALANKEQRGYITTQEFNLLADKAQNEIYENYFYQLNMAQVKPNSQGTDTDITEAIRQKLEPFIRESTGTLIGSDAGGTNTISYTETTPALSSDSFIGSEGYNNSFRIINIINIANNKTVTKVDEREISYILNNPLTSPTNDRRIYIATSKGVEIYPNPSTSVTFRFAYYNSPEKPNWTYVVVNQKALYNSSASDAMDFQLHPSEEEHVVSKILNLAGLTIRQPEVQQSGMMQTQMNKQEQNS